MKRLLATLLCAVALLAPASAHAADTPGVLDGDPTVSDRVAFVQWLDSQADRLPAVAGISSIPQAEAWAVEIVPFYANEGIVQTAHLPADIQFFFTLEPSANFHILGEAACTATGEKDGSVLINGRMENPASTWYGREDSYWTLTHELGHMQGGPFCTGSSYYLEANTQMATAEVMAAMIDSGNTLLLRPWIEEVRDMCLGGLQTEMSADDWNALAASVDGGSAIEAARRAKTARYWAMDPIGLRTIEDKYDQVPCLAIIDGARTGSIDRSENDVAGAMPLFIQTDDIQYLLSHLTDMVSAVVPPTS